MEPTPRELPAGIVGDDAKLLNAAVDRLEALPVVKPPAKLDTKYNHGKGRVIVNLWCGSTHEQGKQPSVPLNNKLSSDPAAVPNWFVATERLITNIEKDHAGCLAAAEQAKAASTKRQHGLCATSNEFCRTLSRPQLVPCSRAAACSRTYPS